MSNATTVKCYSCTVQYDPLDEDETKRHASHVGSEAMNQIDKIHPHERFEALKRMIDNLQMERDKAIRGAYYKEPQIKDIVEDQSREDWLRTQALTSTLSNHRISGRDTPEIIKAAQKFYGFLKGETDE